MCKAALHSLHSLSFRRSLHSLHSYSLRTLHSIHSLNSLHSLHYLRFPHSLHSLHSLNSLHSLHHLRFPRSLHSLLSSLSSLSSPSSLSSLTSLFTLLFARYGFINRFLPGFAPNQIDEESRYAFGKQRDIGWWNVQRLRDAAVGTPYINDWEKSTNQHNGHHLTLLVLAHARSPP
jgi:hypothetical protein